MKTLSIDLETYSSVNLQKCGVYKYAQSEDFEILLFGYSVDSGEVKVVDLACGEKIPDEVIKALSDEAVIKWAFNVIIPGLSEPPVRTLRATIPENRSHIFR